MKTHLAASRLSLVGPSCLRILATMFTLVLAPGLSHLRAQVITTTVPGYISYQGRATTAGNVAIGTGTPVNRKVTFRIWDVASGGATSNLIYIEEQIATIAEGEFSVLIGQGTAPDGFSSKGPPTLKISDPSVFAGATRFLGVTIDDGNSGTVDPEISPRQQIVTAAYAFRAKYAETVGTNGSAALTTLDNGRVGIGTGNPAVKLDVAGGVAAGSGTGTDAGFVFNTASANADGLFSSADNILSLRAAGTDRLYIDAAGRVGIGTATPAAPLDVVGNISTSTGLVASAGHVFSRTNGADDGLFSALDNVVTIRTGGTDRLKVDASGNTTATGILAATSHTFTTANGSLNGLFSAVDNTLSLRTGNSDRLKIDSSGVVSVGTLAGISSNLNISTNTLFGGWVGIGPMAAPGFPLQFANILGEKIVMWDEGTGGNYGFGIQGGTLQIHAAGANADIAFGYGTSGGMTERMRIKGSGYVGIGTNNPQAPLDVRGHADMGFFLEGVLDAVSPRDIPNQFITLQETIVAETRIRAAAFDVISDSRIKNIAGTSSGQTDLETLMKIEVTDYTFKDTITQSKKPQKKVIAQQVETVYPQAVGLTTDVVPDKPGPNNHVVIEVANSGSWNVPAGRAGQSSRLVQLPAGKRWAIQTAAGIPVVVIGVILVHIRVGGGVETLWISCDGSLVRVDVARWRAAPPEPPVKLSLRQVTSGRGRRLALAGGWKLPFNDRSLQVQFSAPALGADTDALYETTLISTFGTDVRADTKPERDFSALGAGSYTLRIRARHRDGGWSEPAVLAFGVLPPWWLSPLAITAYAAAMIALLAAAWRARTHRWRRIQHALEGAVAARTLDLARQNAELARLRQIEFDEKLAARLAEDKARLEVLRYQLNPHFLFNTLTSVCAQIIQSPRNARETVIRLAEFCRLTLHRRGEADEPTLGEEIEMLRAYLDIEQTRLGALLEYSITCDPALASFHLPPFLLLPLLENAVKYGAATSKDRVRIRISLIQATKGGVDIEVANTGHWVASSTEPRSVPSLGIGLENLRQRLARYFPDRHVFATEASDGWVVVRLHLDFPPAAAV